MELAPALVLSGSLVGLGTLVAVAIARATSRIVAAIDRSSGMYPDGVQTEVEYKAFDEELARIHLEAELEDLDYGDLTLEYEPEPVEY